MNAELLNEISLLSTLQHPNLPVLRGISTGTSTEISYITDAVQQTLAERIRQWKAKSGSQPDEDDTPIKGEAIEYWLAWYLQDVFQSNSTILLC